MAPPSKSTEASGVRLAPVEIGESLMMHHRNLDGDDAERVAVGSGRGGIAWWPTTPLPPVRFTTFTGFP